MAKRRGFFAEVQHQMAVAERERQRAQAAAARDAQRRQRDAERARAAAQRARAAAGRADARARAAAEKEAKRLHMEAQEAEVELMNSDLASQLEDIDTVLAWTLDIDDHVDLEQLRQVAEHPPFSSPRESPLPAPSPIAAGPEPTFVELPAPKGLGGLFAKKKHAAEVAAAREKFEGDYKAWQAEVAAVPMRQLQQMQQHQTAEAERTAKLEHDRAAYEAECRARQEAVDAQNAQLDDLIARLNIGEREAVEEYFSIVFGNSVYPDALTVDIEHTYQVEDKELAVAVRLPAPSDVPAVRSYKYVKAKDEISHTSQTAKEQRDRYANLVHSIVLRTLHEVWESDRLGHVQTIALTAGVDHIDPATGKETRTPLVAVAAHREVFEEIDLAKVTPVETLKHLSAVVSKNPHGLVPIAGVSGVRG